MSHFYSGIQGQAGDATRMGSKASGISGYVQSWGARLSVDMDHSSVHDIDTGHFRLGPGPSSGSGGALAMTFRDTDQVVEALGTGDKRIEAIRERIYREVQKLNEEAPKAIKRTQRKAKIDRNRREREQQRLNQERLDIIRDLQPEEKARLVRIADDIELDRDGNIEMTSANRLSEIINDYKPRIEHGHTLIEIRRLGWLQNVPFDLTDGQWILPFDPDEGDVLVEDYRGFGWRCEKVPA